MCVYIYIIRPPYDSSPYGQTNKPNSPHPAPAATTARPSTTVMQISMPPRVRKLPCTIVTSINNRIEPVFQIKTGSQG